MVKVSIIVAVYNVEKYIIKCLESVKKQTFSDFECLIISDGSKDKSVDLAKQFSIDDSRFKVIEKENGGYGSVLEKGIELAEGEYILICDPDDYLAEDAVEHLYNLALKNNSDLVFGARYDVYENPHEEVYKTGYDITKYNLNSEITYSNKEMDFSKFFSFDCSPHSKLYKKDVIYKGPYPHNIGYTDMILYCLTMNKLEIITYTPKPCSYYLLEREGNTMTASKDKFIKAHIEILNRLLDGINDNGNTQSYICIIDTFRYCFSFLDKIENPKVLISEFKKISNRIYIKRKYFVRYLKYAQGGVGQYVTNMLIFNSVIRNKCLDYLYKNSK